MNKTQEQLVTTGDAMKLLEEHLNKVALCSSAASLLSLKGCLKDPEVKPVGIRVLSSQQT